MLKYPILGPPPQWITRINELPSTTQYSNNASNTAVIKIMDANNHNNYSIDDKNNHNINSYDNYITGRTKFPKSLDI